MQEIFQLILSSQFRLLPLRLPERSGRLVSCRIVFLSGIFRQDHFATNLPEHANELTAGTFFIRPFPRNPKTPFQNEDI